MRRLHRFAALFVLSCLFLPSGAETIRIDERKAVDLARSASSAVAGQGIDLAAKERKAETRYSFLLPQTTLSAVGRESVSQAGSALTALPTAIIRFSSSLNLSAAGLQSARTSVLDALAARLQSRATVEQLEKDSRKAFYKLLLLAEQARVAESAVEISLGSLERTREAYGSGLASQRTRRQAEIAYETEKLSLARRLSEYRSARAAFAQKLGLRDDDWALEGKLNVEPVDLGRFGGFREGLSSRADVALALASASLQESKVEEARRSLLIPTLGLAAQIDMTKTGGGDIQPSGLFSLTLSSPSLGGLLPFSSDAVSLEASRGTLRKLRLLADDAARAAALEIDTLFRSLSVSASSIGSLQASVGLAEEVVALTREAYDAGAVSYQDLRTAEKDADTARIALLSERYAYIAALIDLEYAVGASVRSAKESS